MLKKLPKFTKNFFFIIAASFLLWMVFIDSNDFLSQYKLTKQLNNLEQEKSYYTNKIEEVKEERVKLLSNKDLLEKFAREKYLMKKKTEDIFVVVDKNR